MSVAFHHRDPNELKVHGIELPREVIGDHLDPMFNYEVSVFEAKRLVRVAKGRKISIHAQQCAYNIKSNDLCRAVSAYVTVGKKEALRYITNAYERVEGTHHVRVTVSGRILFIG